MKNFGQAWAVNFADGSVLTQGGTAYLRVVRGGTTEAATDRLTLPVAPSPFEVVTANNTVYDPRTLLRWDRCPFGVAGTTCGDGVPSTFTWQQALQLPMLANAANHKGFSDWRLANKNELESIVDLTVLPPSIEAAIFPNTPLTGFFTSTLNMKSFGQAWKVNFNDGSVYTDAHGNAAPVRLVREGGTSAATDRFNLPMPPSPYSTANGIVTDARTGLIWDNCSFGKTGSACTGASVQVSNWQDALLTSNAANNTSYKGFNDWRVPNKNELESLVDLGRLAPVIDESVFPDTQSQLYWSSTVNAKSAGQVWAVNFGDGSVSALAHGTTAYFRLVRGGSAADGLDVTAPVLSAVSGTVSTLTATSNEAATGYWIVVPRGATAPTAAQVRARATYGSVTLAANGTGAMAASVAATFGISGLSAAAQYDAYIVAVDAVGNVSLAALAQFGTLPINGSCGTANGVAVTTGPTTNLCATGTASPAIPTGPGPWTWSCVGANTGTTAPCSAPLRDTTPPTLTNVAATTTTFTATSDEAGTGYWIALARSAAAPTAAQVRAYALLGASGVLARGTGAMVANVSALFAVTGLTATVLYDFYVVAEDVAGNSSGLVKSQNAVDPACAASSVATIEFMNLSQNMTDQAQALLTAAALRSTFNVTCANGRFGVVRLPKVVAAALGGEAYALVQSSCTTNAADGGCRNSDACLGATGVGKIRQSIRTFGRQFSRAFGSVGVRMKIKKKSRVIAGMCAVIMGFSGTLTWAFKPDYESHGHTMIARAILDGGYTFGERAGVPWTVAPFRYTLSDDTPRELSKAAIDQIIQGVQSRDWLAVYSTATPTIDVSCSAGGAFALPGRDAYNHLRAETSDGGCLILRVSGDLTDEDGHFDNDNFAGSTKAIYEHLAWAYTYGVSAADQNVARLDRESRRVAARVFLGKAIHTIQDFYAHSNWAETRASNELFLPLTDAITTQGVLSPDAMTQLASAQQVKGATAAPTGGGLRNGDTCASRKLDWLVLPSDGTLIRGAGTFGWGNNDGNFSYVSGAPISTSAWWGSLHEAFGLSDFHAAASDSDGNARCDHGSSDKAVETTLKISGIAKDMPNWPLRPSPAGTLTGVLEPKADDYSSDQACNFDRDPNDPNRCTVVSAMSGKTPKIRAAADATGVHLEASYHAARHTKVLLEKFVERIRTRAASVGQADEIIEAIFGAKPITVGRIWVVDRSGRMADTLPAIRSEIARAIQADELVALVSSNLRKYTLVDFNGDSDANNDPLLGVASGSAQFVLQRAASLVATGGGGCRTPIWTATEAALRDAPRGSVVMVFTDASSSDAAAKEASVMKLAQDRGVKIVKTITGSCSPLDPSYGNVANGTNGSALLVEHSAEGIAAAGAIADAAFESERTVHTESATLTASKVVSFPVESGVSKLTVVASGALNSISVMQPSGAALADGATVAISQILNGYVYVVNTPQQGNWQVALNGTGTYSLSAYVSAAIDFDFVEHKSVLKAGRPGHEYRPQLAPTGQSGRAWLKTHIVGGQAPVLLDLLRMDGTTIATFPLEKMTADYFEGEITLSTESNRLRVRGFAADNTAFARIYAQGNVAAPAAPKGQIVAGAGAVGTWRAGTVNAFAMNLKNLGGDDTVSLTAGTLPSGATLTCIPASVALPGSQQVNVLCSVFLPETVDRSDFTVTVATATSGQVVTVPLLPLKLPLSCALDIDGDNRVEPLIDGMLLTRYLLGFRGNALTDGLTITGPRKTANRLNTFFGSAAQFDVVGRATPAPTAMVDGLLMTRLMLGFDDTALLTGISLPADARYRTASAIKDYVISRCAGGF